MRQRTRNIVDNFFLLRPPIVRCRNQLVGTLLNAACLAVLLDDVGRFLIRDELPNTVRRPNHEDVVRGIDRMPLDVRYGNDTHSLAHLEHHNSTDVKS